MKKNLKDSLEEFDRIIEERKRTRQMSVSKVQVS